MVGKKIAKLRQAQYLTQNELAERAGISVSYLSRIENRNAKPHITEDEFAQYEYVDMEYEDADVSDALVQVKVSSDGGETWARREIDLGGDIDESGLEAGEIFQINGEKYKVLSGDFSLTIEGLRYMS